MNFLDIINPRALLDHFSQKPKISIEKQQLVFVEHKLTRRDMFKKFGYNSPELNTYDSNISNIFTDAKKCWTLQNENYYITKNLEYIVNDTKDKYFTSY